MTTVFDFPRQFRTYTSASFQLQSINFGSSSMFNRAPNIYGTAEQVWVVNLTLPIMKTATHLAGVTGDALSTGYGTKLNDYRDLSGFLAKLKGRKNYVRLHDSFRCYPRGTGAGSFENVTAAKSDFTDDTKFTDGTKFVDSQGDFSLGRHYATLGENGVAGSNNILISNLVANQANSLMTGDLISIGNHLYEITDNAPSDAAGQSRVYIAPNLRQSYVAGDTVKLAFPTGIFALVDDTQGQIMRDAMTNTTTVGLSFIEVII